MKRLSIPPPSSSKRKSSSSNNKDDDLHAARQILEQLDQDTTSVLQDIDKNISRANQIINDRIIPAVKGYAIESQKVWENAGFWKHFFEQSANIELNTYEEPIDISKGVFTKEDEENQSDSDPLLKFKKPLLRHQDEETPTWSTDQKATPKRREKSDLSSIQQKPSPVKIHTIRQSLEAYHRLSVSPKKQQDSQRTPLSTRRQTVIQNILNSSPTFPEPPILKSEIGTENNSNIFQASSSPKKPIDLQKFPDTPKYKRLSGGSIPNLNKDDEILEPPQLSDKVGEGTVSSSLNAPELRTIKDSSNKRRKTNDPDNIFLERNSPSNHSEHSNHSKSRFDEALLNLRDQLRPPNSGDEVNEVVKDVTENVKKDASGKDNDNLTAELGPLREKWDRLTNKKGFSS
ncbi:unnamed protein product [Candida verbasci]|uniref:DASH complex subunit ASK1 n=1 Tax=Candida verbasci TaxID=1227364 RepID=A0A9W4U1A9_9ASCO|nr:unnamed protein product [Candida verbasci]